MIAARCGALSLTRHELAHHNRKHTSRRMLLLPGLSVPFLGSGAVRSITEDGLFVWFAEVVASHPRLPKRVAAVLPGVTRIPVGAIASAPFAPVA